MCAYQFIYTTKRNQLTESEFVLRGAQIGTLFKMLQFAIFRVAVW